MTFSTASAKSGPSMRRLPIKWKGRNRSGPPVRDRRCKCRRSDRGEVDGPGRSIRRFSAGQRLWAVHRIGSVRSKSLERSCGRRPHMAVAVLERIGERRYSNKTCRPHVAQSLRCIAPHQVVLILDCNQQNGDGSARRWAHLAEGMDRAAAPRTALVFDNGN